MFKISNGTNYKQLFMLVITGFVGLFFMLLYKFSNNINYIYIIILFCSISLISNIFYSTLFDINITGNKIYINNLYKKLEVNGTEFYEVQFANRFYFHFYIPLFYMSPPYYIFKLKDGRRFFFFNSSSSQAFNSIFSPKNYVEELNKNINDKLDISNKEV